MTDNTWKFKFEYEIPGVCIKESVVWTQNFNPDTAAKPADAMATIDEMTTETCLGDCDYDGFTQDSLNLGRWDEWANCKGQVVSKPLEFDPDSDDDTTNPMPYSVQLGSTTDINCGTFKMLTAMLSERTILV